MEGNALFRALAQAFVDALKSSDTDDSAPPEPVHQLDLPIVRVAYGALTEAVPDNGPEGRYVYYWPFSTPPVAGLPVIVPTWNEPENHAVVTGVGAAEEANGAQILTVTRLAADEEVDAARNEVFEAQRKREADMRAWLAIAQRLAGFPPGSTGTPPDEYPYTPIPPIDDTIPRRESAKDCGFVWRRVHRRAEEYGLPECQVTRFKRISDRWYDIAFGRPVRDL